MTLPTSAIAAPAGVSPGRWSARALLGLIRAEARKTRSTSAWWALLLPAALAALLVTWILALGTGLAFLPSVAQSLALRFFSVKFAVVFGLVCATAETRHRTLATSYLTAPGRPQLLVAKLVVAAVVGALYAVVSSVFGLFGMLIGGVGDSISDDLDSVLTVSGVAVAVFALWAMFGVGIGTLISNQLASIVGVLIYLLLGEGLLVTIAREAGFGQLNDYLPGNASEAALAGVARNSPFGELLGPLTMPWWLSMLIFVGYTVVAVLAGAALAQRRDVT